MAGKLQKNHRLNRLVAIAFIGNPERKPFVDHINGNITNNSVGNLRWATNTENNRNRKLNRNSTSKVKGVSFNKRNKKWQAMINIDRW